MYCANYVCLYISTEIAFMVGQVIAVFIYVWKKEETEEESGSYVENFPVVFFCNNFSFSGM